MRAQPVVRGCAILGAVLFAVGGVWAMASPRSFFADIATYPPYNEHLFHDLGAFQLGIAAALVAGLLGSPGLVVGLWAGAVGASVHSLSHWMDADLGGRASDPPSLTVLAVVLVVGLVAAEAAVRTGRRAGDAPR